LRIRHAVDQVLETTEDNSFEGRLSGMSNCCCFLSEDWLVIFRRESLTSWNYQKSGRTVMCVTSRRNLLSHGSIREKNSQKNYVSETLPFGEIFSLRLMVEAR